MSVVLATAGYDHIIRFWEAPSGRCSRRLKFPDSPVHRIEISPDKQFIAAAGNPMIHVYEVLSDNGNDNIHQKPVLTLEGHESNVTSIGFQKDGRFLYSGSEDGTVKVWDLRNPNYSHQSFDVGAAVNSVALRSDRDEFISGDQDGYVKIWDGASGKCINKLKPTAGNLPIDGASNHIPISSSKSHRQFSEGAVPIQAVDISDDSRTLVAISNHGTVFVWDPSVGRAPTPSLADESPDDLNGIHSHSNAATVTSLLTPVTKFRAHAPGTYCLHGKVSPDCRQLVTCSSDGTAKLWDTTTWELQSTLNCGDKWVWDAAFCADSTYLVTASSDRVARLWNLRSGEVVRHYQEHELAVTCVALNDSNV